MRPATQIEPAPLAVDLDVLVFGKTLYNLRLISFAHVAEHAYSVGPVPNFLRENVVSVYDLAHLGFDSLQVCRRERLIAGKIVVEAIFDVWADGYLSSRE